MPILNPTPNFNLIGHRGTAGLRPENTFCSFQHAAELGLNWIEFDVQLTKDHQWIVMHDSTIDRTTNGKGQVKHLTASELQNFEAGLWFDPPYPDQKIPSLIDTLNLATKLNLHCNIEIKGAEDDAQLHATLMHEFILAHPEINFSQHLFSSFDLPCMMLLRLHQQNLPIGYLIDYFTEQTLSIASDNDFTCINCDVKTISIDNIQAAAKLNIPVLLYTVNDPYLAKTWLDAGVSAIFTNRPDLLLHN